MSLSRITSPLVHFKKPKIPFINSALYHAKNFDTHMVVVDVDEVVVAVQADETAAAALGRALARSASSTSCYHTLHSGTVNAAVGRAAPSLAAACPFRCESGSYPKAVANLARANYVGLHKHDANPAVRCGSGGTLDGGIVRHLHYINFWKDRRNSRVDPSKSNAKRNCSTPNEFARAWREGPPAWARPSVHDEARS